MTNPYSLGPWLRRFLEEHLVSERNLARNTQLSYRDTLALVLPFVAGKARMPIDRLAVRDLSAERALAFLAHIENGRGCSPRTRNQRLAAPYLRPLRRHPLPRACRMVRPDPRYRVEKNCASCSELP